jgi:hypothetical protein
MVPYFASGPQQLALPDCRVCDQAVGVCPLTDDRKAMDEHDSAA